VGNIYPPQHAGGYEIAWQQVMRQARAVGHRVRILTTAYREDPQRGEDDPDVHRTLRWYWDLERYEFPRLNLMQRLAHERHNRDEMRRQVKSFGPDVVAWFPMGCMSLSLIEQVRRADIPAIFIVHDDWLVYGWEHDCWLRTWSGRRRRVAGRVAERVCGVPARVDVSRAGAFIFNSRYTLGRAREVGVTSGAMTVIPPGIDERFLKPVAPAPWQWRMVYVGRIDRQKGIDTAVSALAHLPPQTTFSVWGTGDGRYVAAMKELAARLGVVDRVRFPGFADAATIRSVYAHADAVIFPVRWNEPFGLVPLEAMGLGRPVVTTARGGTAEFVRDGENALVFAAEDPAALAACIERLAADADLRARLREGGRHTAAQYTEGRFARRTLEEILRAARGAE